MEHAYFVSISMSAQYLTTFLQYTKTEICVILCKDLLTNKIDYIKCLKYNLKYV